MRSPSSYAVPASPRPPAPHSNHSSQGHHPHGSGPTAYAASPPHSTQHHVTSPPGQYGLAPSHPNMLPYSRPSMSRPQTMPCPAGATHWAPSSLPSGHLPNPYEEGFRPAPARAPTRPRQDDAELQAVLEASRSSAAQEAARRRRVEDEELRSLAALHEQEQAERARREEERRRREEEDVRRGIEESQREEVLRRSRQQEEERRVLEESLREEEARRHREDAELRRVMEASRLEEEARRRWERELASSASRGSDAPPRLEEPAEGPPHDRPSRRPLPSTPLQPSLPRLPGAEDTDDRFAPDHYRNDQHSAHHHIPEDPAAEVQSEDTGDPFTDEAEAPPAYDVVGIDRPPEAPSRAPTGFWDQVRAQRVAMNARDTADQNHMGPQNSPQAGQSHTSSDEPSPKTAPNGSEISLRNDGVREDTAVFRGPSAEREHDDQSREHDTLPSTSAEEPTISEPRISPGVDTHMPEMAAPRSPARASSSTAESSEPQGRRRLGQRAPAGIDWGYSSQPFATRLHSGPKDLFLRAATTACTEEDFAPEDEQSIKQRFPLVITLQAAKRQQADVPIVAADTEQSHFTLRAGSWKLLLRSLAALGNTRIEAGPEEIADAATRTTEGSAATPLLRVQVEFVTPTSARRSDSPAAFVSACFSLAASGKRTRSASLVNQQQAFQRELDMEVLKQGSVRKIVSLPSWALSSLEAPDQSQCRDPSGPEVGLPLPCSALTLAEQMKRSHRLSASCPSSGASARHYPRDLYHYIEAHDEKYIVRVVTKQVLQLASQPSTSSNNTRDSISRAVVSSVYPGGPQILLLDPTTLTARSAESQQGPMTSRPELWGPLFPSSTDPSNRPGLNLRKSSGSNSASHHPSPEQRNRASSSTSAVPSGREHDSQSNSVRLPDRGDDLDHDAPPSPMLSGEPVSFVYAEEGELRSSHLGRVKDRVRRKWRGRQGDVDDDDLANWITPLDLSDVG